MLGRLETGYDKQNHRWELCEENNLWVWRKFKDSKVIMESDKTFETREECEADAKTHGMDGEFFKLL